MRICQEAQLLFQESSSLWGRWLRWEPAFIAVCWPLGRTGPTALLSISQPACRCTGTVCQLSPHSDTGLPCLGNTEWPGGCTTMASNLPLWRCSAVSYHVLLWEGQPYQQPQMHVCFPLAHPSFSQSLIDPSGESHKPSWGAEELLNPLLVASFCKVLGTHVLEISQCFSALHPFRSHPWPAFGNSEMSLLCDRDVQNCISALTGNTAKRKSGSSGCLRTTHIPTKMSISLP